MSCHLAITSLTEVDEDVVVVVVVVRAGTLAVSQTPVSFSLRQQCVCLLDLYRI